MGIFDTILSAIDNPDQQGSNDDISNVLGNIQRISQDYNVNPDTLADAVSVVGNYVKGSLQETKNNEGESQVNNILNQLSGAPTDSDPDNILNNPNLGLLFNLPQVQEMIEQIGSRTGLPEPIVRSILPSLVNVVVKFVQTGSFQDNSLVNNPVARMFLDGDKDGDVDLGDAMKLASRYLGF